LDCVAIVDQVKAYISEDGYITTVQRVSDELSAVDQLISIMR